MAATSPVLVYSKLPSSSFSCCNVSKHKFFSHRHFHKQLVCNSQQPRIHLELPKSLLPESSIPFSNVNSSPSRQYLSGFRSSLMPVQCSSSYSDAPETVVFESLKGFSLDSVKMGLSQLTPFKVLKWGLMFSIAAIASKWMLNVLVNPFFWMYFSMTWLYWPWMVALSFATYSFYCLNKHLRGEANVVEQFVIVSSAFTWLTLVPPAHFNGFLEGWPVVFFLVYHYFFFLNVSIRKRMYGDYKPREHDPRWDVSLPKWKKLLFCVGVMVGHWVAAFEGPELHLVPGGWSNLGIWGLIVMAVFMQYHSSLYLAKYSEKVVVPTAVVQFGPYRFVRHPIYASTMLLFVAYCIALRAPLSALFIAVVCSVYYGNKAKLEECLMVENFGERYMEYASKVRYKLIPYVY
ncbi:hypothetical protein FXO38_33612 [Capsicum annuum]|uniref:Protein-S-isoprenylcysteine O-methyltransferase n=1 Tax=Capsicum annuum TaxID=4072 RepID=A0A2G2Z0X7_CAPAN|nr:uncharacterized protein LOC107852722 [Capsicum annuum]KAF3618086.1 hypothetical protein FXO38_33612 [Capsicum annuum]PHT75525.1 hypothetical protein T459_19047 [Capsicum annuum]